MAVDDVGEALEDTRKVVDVSSSSCMMTVVEGLEADCIYQFEMWAYTHRAEGHRTRQWWVKTHGAGRPITADDVLTCDRQRRFILVKCVFVCVCFSVSTQTVITKFLE